MRRVSIDHHSLQNFVDILADQKCSIGLAAKDAEIVRLRRALCEYQLKYWTLQYKSARFFRPLFGDDDENWSDETGGGK